MGRHIVLSPPVCVSPHSLQPTRWRHCCSSVTHTHTCTHTRSHFFNTGSQAFSRIVEMRTRNSHTQHTQKTRLFRGIADAFVPAGAATFVSVTSQVSCLSFWLDACMHACCLALPCLACFFFLPPQQFYFFKPTHQSIIDTGYHSLRYKVNVSINK